MVSQKPKGKVATSKLSNPVVEESLATQTRLCAFAPGGEYFAIVHRPANNSILRVHETATSSLRCEYVIESAPVSSLSWVNMPLDTDSSRDGSSPSKKRKKRSNPQQALQLVTTLGLQDGSVEFFSLEHSAVIRRIKAPDNSIKAGIRSVCVTPEGKEVWTLNEEGLVKIWNASTLAPLHQWQPKLPSPFTALEFRPNSQDGAFIAGGPTVGLYHPQYPSHSQPFLASEAFKFEGHSTPIKQMIWEASQSPRRFVSTATGDRFFNVWEIPAPGSSNVSGLLASVGLDAEVRDVAVTAAHAGEHLLLATSTSGRAVIYAIPQKKLDVGESLAPLSTFVSSASSTHSEILGATFIGNNKGHVRFAQLVGGAKVDFLDSYYLDDKGDFQQSIRLESTATKDSSAQGANLPGVSLRRYDEHSVMATRAGGPSIESQPGLDNGEIEADRAELTLGERLLTLHGPQDSGNLNVSGKKKNSRREGKSGEKSVEAVPVHSLSRTLTQALHSSDSRLLESCLAYSQPTIIRNTVQLLPPQLAIPLISACVERLGRGHRGASMKGGGGGASAQRGMGLIAWVKATLVIHSGYLMAVPDLAARLAALHAVLTSRLTLQSRLTSLSGRLDLVLAQMELRASSTNGAGVAPDKIQEIKQLAQYNEGESSDELDTAGIQNDDEGSIEDVVLNGSGDEGLSSDKELEGPNGGSSEGEEEFSEEESGLEETDSDEDSEASGPRRNDLIDDEAEEWSEEEDEESE